MPESMQFPDITDVWMPLIPTARQEQRDHRPLRIFGRLADGVSVEQARVELNGIAQRIAKAYPDATKDLVGARVETFSERFVNGAPRIVFTVLLWFVGFVLLIACANVANLLLSRSAQRAREIAVRMALGATRQRVLRQLLIESLLLGVIGGGLGLLIAFLGVPVFDASITDAGKPFWIVFKVDRVVVMYVAAICILTSIAFGLAPALHVSRANMHDVLKESGRSSVGGKRVRWFSGAMVVVELALTLVLLGRRRPDDSQLRQALRAGSRIQHERPDGDARDSSAAEIRGAGRAPPVLRTARAAAPDHSRRRCGGGDDERAAVRVGGAADRD